MTNKGPVEIGATAYTSEMRTQTEIERYASLKEKATYVHVSDAKFHYSLDDDLTGRRGVIWRGLTEKVSGYHFQLPRNDAKYTNPKQAEVRF